MALWTRVAAGRGYFAAELVFLRMGFAALACAGLFASGLARLRLRRPGLLLARGLLGSGAILLFFYALCQLPVGEATLLNFTSPLFTTLFAALFLRERPGPRLILALGLTLVGLAMTVDPAAGSPLSWGMAAGLASAVMSGAAVTTVRALRGGLRPGLGSEASREGEAGEPIENAPTILFTFACIACLVSAPFVAAAPTTPRPADLPLLGALGLSSIAAQLLSSDAMGYVSAVTAAVTGPLTPLLAFAFGAIFLGEPWPPRVVAGSFVALAGVVFGSSPRALEGAAVPALE